MDETDLGARIDGIAQLGSVVRAMTGIATARAQTARAQISAIEGYAFSLDRAVSQLMDASARLPEPQRQASGDRRALIVVCAEQGFVGGFSRHVLDQVAPDAPDLDIYMIGSRGAAQAMAFVPIWSGAMPSRSASLPKCADTVLSAIFAQSAPREIAVLSTVWAGGQGKVQRRQLSLDLPAASAQGVAPPLLNLPALELAASLAQDHLHAQLTRALLLAFVAENEARIAAMSAASRQISDELTQLRAKARVARQEAITAEIIEIVTAGLASH